MSDAFFDDITFLANKAVKLAQEENRKLGIPNVYSFKGTMIFELPDGTLTFENPFEYKTAATAITSMQTDQDTESR